MCLAELRNKQNTVCGSEQVSAYNFCCEIILSFAYGMEKETGDGE